jgi:hypothetical protein
LIPAIHLVEGNVEDAFWMEDDMKVVWEESTPDLGRSFRRPHNARLTDKLSFLDSQIERFIFQTAQYAASDTGSQYLDPAWRKNITRVNPLPARMEAYISLN